MIISEQLVSLIVRLVFLSGRLVTNNLPFPLTIFKGIYSFPIGLKKLLSKKAREFSFK